MPSRHNSVDSVPTWSHTMNGGMINPVFKPYQCLLTSLWKRMAQLPKRSAGVAPEVNLRERIRVRPYRAKIFFDFLKFSLIYTDCSMCQEVWPGGGRHTPPRQTPPG